jgi:hypothetical protein
MKKRTASQRTMLGLHFDLEKFTRERNFTEHFLKFNNPFRSDLYSRNTISHLYSTEYILLQFFMSNQNKQGC